MEKTTKLSFRQRLFLPVDASSITVFRIGFGLILLWDVIRYWNKGWIEGQYIEPSFYFKYYGFSWIEPWPGDGMYIHFAFMGLMALLIMLGAAYRIAIVLFTLAFTYVFLLDQAQYLNHFYLVILFSILLCVIPAHRQFSIDAWLRPKLRSSTVPAWTVWLLRAQMEIMLLYAGIVKINPDWLQLEPLRMWLAQAVADKDLPLWLEHLYVQDWAIAMAAYGAIILHIVGAPLLLWKRTRLAVFLIYAAFHLQNHLVFDIGIFPWFTLFGTLIFFDPDWPKQLSARIKSLFKRNHIKPTGPAFTPPPSGTNSTSALQQNLIIAFLWFWVISQTLIPLRHFLYPGNVAWTEEGHRFSWQMKLRDKRAWIRVLVIDRDNRVISSVNPLDHLSRKQFYVMSIYPDMVLQFAHHLEDFWEREHGATDVEVRIEHYVSLNGRKPQLFYDSRQDLTEIERNLQPADWLYPLTGPLVTSNATEN